MIIVIGIMVICSSAIYVNIDSDTVKSNLT